MADSMRGGSHSPPRDSPEFSRRACQANAATGPPVRSKTSIGRRVTHAPQRRQLASERRLQPGGASRPRLITGPQ